MLDARIPLQVRAPRLDEMGGAYEQGLRLRDMVNVRRAKEAEAAESARYKNTLMGLLQINDINTPEGQQQFTRDLATVGYAPQAMEFAKTWKGMQKTDAEIAKLKQPPTPASKPKPDYLKGKNGNYWVAGADGTMQDTGIPFHMDPKPEPQGTIIQIPGAPPMRVVGNQAIPISGAPVVPERPDAAAKPLTEGQSNAALFGRRMELALHDMGRLEKAGYNRASATAGAGAMLPNMLQTGRSQEQENAERNFLTAVLRRESGATIQPSEFETGERLYFPRAGDKPETLAQKKRNREQALAGLRTAAGPAWDSTPSSVPTWDAAPQQGPVQVRTKAERDALPPGTAYIGPDGKRAVKK